MPTNSMLAQHTVWSIESETPATFIEIAEVTDWDGLGSGESADIDATSLDSLAKEYRLGLSDPGSVTLNLFFLPHDPGQKLMQTAMDGQLIKNWKVTFNETLDASITTPTVATFTGGVKSYPGASGSVDDLVRGTATIRLSGQITVVEGT